MQVALRDYAIELERTAVRADRVTFAIVNEDSAPHNLAVVASPLPPEQLPTTGIRLDEASPQIQVLAKSATAGPGQAMTLQVTLGPGTYVLVCTVPHHYVRSLMFATFSVEEVLG